MFTFVQNPPNMKDKVDQIIDEVFDLYEFYMAAKIISENLCLNWSICHSRHNWRLTRVTTMK